MGLWLVGLLAGIAGITLGGLVVGFLARRRQEGRLADTEGRHQRQVAALRAEHAAAVSRLAGGLAHELRNPLTSMKILIQAAVEAGPSAAVEGRDLQILEEEMSRLEQGIQTFVDFARPPKLSIQYLDLAAVLQQTMELVKSRASCQGVRLDCQTPSQAILAYADRAQLRDVLVNLLNNSLDAMPQGGNLRVDLQRESTEGSAAPQAAGQPDRPIVIRVCDDGPGLPVEFGDRIFEPFVSTKDTGLGLGLPVCRKIIEAQGGQIQGRTLPLGGAEFTIRLPEGRPHHERSETDEGQCGNPEARESGAPPAQDRSTDCRPAQGERCTR